MSDNIVRIAISSADRGASLIEEVTFEDLGICEDEGTTVKPPDELVKAVTESKALSPEERVKMLKSLVDAYEKSVKEADNAPIEELIAEAVVNYVINEHGWSKEDIPNVPRISEDIVVQKVDGVYIATASAVMG